jgi:hypothetical protein
MAIQLKSSQVERTARDDLPNCLHLPAFNLPATH